MRDKVVVITGGSSGLGLAAAGQLAKLGAEVAIVCRDARRGELARTAIARRATAAQPSLFLADLSSQADVRTVAAKIRDRFPRVAVLVNNAGAIFARRELTADGIEKTLAVNHLAPFLLTNLLLDAMADDGRIVMVASPSYSSALDFNNLQGERSYGFFSAYMRSKLGNILFTYELARRLAGTRITANCASPEPARTPFGNAMPGWRGLLARTMKRLPVMLDPEESARAIVHVASSPDLGGVSGRYFLKQRETRTKAVTYDREVAGRLWSVSAALCGGFDTVPADEERSGPAPHIEGALRREHGSPQGARVGESAGAAGEES